MKGKGNIMVDFSSKNEGMWFFFDKDDQDKGGVCLRELTPDQIEQIERITVKTKKKFKRGVAYDDITTDEKLANKLRWDYVIFDWQGVSLDGVVLECNRDNKTKIMKVGNFIKFVADSIEALTEQNGAIEEARLKNSGDTSSSDTE